VASTQRLVLESFCVRLQTNPENYVHIYIYIYIYIYICVCVCVNNDNQVRVRFPALPHFLRRSWSGTGSTQPLEYN
jgi:hypothetical protein